MYFTNALYKLGKLNINKFNLQYVLFIFQK